MNTPLNWLLSLYSYSKIRKYIILDYFYDEKEDKKDPSFKVHYRRQHLRHLQSNFYKNKKGSYILIPAIWCGKTSKILGNKEYKVRIDV